MALVSLESLIAKLTKSQIYEMGLAVARAVKLPVTSWHAGDPTRSQYLYQAEVLEVLEGVVAEYIRGGFLDFAEGVWLKLTAKQVYNEDVREATYASTPCTLTNTGGGLYTLEPGDLTARSSVTNKTYHSITGGTLLPRPPGGDPTTLSIDFEADEPGSASSAGPGEIDEIVTPPLLGVTISNPTSAVGLDEEEKDAVVTRSRSKLGSLSPNGPRDAYQFVALTPRLTGVTSVTRARSVGDSDTGDVTLYIASASGPVPEPDRLAVEQAVVRWATPLTITPTVLGAAAVVVAVTYELWLYVSVSQTEAEVLDKVERALALMAARRPIGGDRVPPLGGRLFGSLIKATIENTLKPYAFRVEVTTPAGDVELAAGEVPVIGAVAGVIHFVQDP